AVLRRTRNILDFDDVDSLPVAPASSRRRPGAAGSRYRHRFPAAYACRPRAAHLYGAGDQRVPAPLLADPLALESRARRRHHRRLRYPGRNDHLRLAVRDTPPGEILA